MKLSQAASILLAIANHLVSAQNDTATDAATPTTTAECTLEAIPIREDDFGEPDWETILEIAFPTWSKPANGCPRLDSLDGELGLRVSSARGRKVQPLLLHEGICRT